MEIVEVYSDDIAEGYVVDYNSKREGNNVKEGVTVKIEVSKGPSGFILEDYRGKKIDVVKLELESKGIKVVATSKNVSTEQEDYEDAFEGKILEQSKEAGTRLKEGNVIELTYATLVTVYPDFTDGTYKVKKIQEFCDDNGITCVFEYVETVDHPDGTILTQSRAKDVEVKKGVTLRIEVAKTPAVEDPFINE